MSFLYCSSPISQPRQSLSLLHVKRSKKIKVQYVDKHQNNCIIELTDIDARCFLHELDHLNGVCFTDKVSQLKLALALKKQRKKNGRTK